MKSLLFCLLSAAALPAARGGPPMRGARRPAWTWFRPLRSAGTPRRGTPDTRRVQAFRKVGELWRTMLERNHTGGGK